MTQQTDSLLKRITDHWVYAVAFVVVTTAGITFAALQALIVTPLRDQLEAQKRLVTASATEASRTPTKDTADTPQVAADLVLGTYEWQWAGERWYGRMTFANHDQRNVVSSAKVGLLDKHYIDDEHFTFDLTDNVLDLVEPGSFEVVGDTVTINVTVYKHKLVRGQNVRDRQTIRGTLERKVCLAGNVSYQSSAGDVSPGGMVLVRHSSLRDENVDRWFANK